MKRSDRLNRVVDTTALLQINDRAIENEYAHTLNEDELRESLNTEGLHVVVPLGYDRIKRDELLFEVYMACEIYLNIANQTHARVYRLDVPHRDFLSLPTTIEYGKMAS